VLMWLCVSVDLSLYSTGSLERFVTVNLLLHTVAQHIPTRVVLDLIHFCLYIRILLLILYILIKTVNFG